MIVLGETASVCPECLATVPAQLRAAGQNVFLYKVCPEHGAFQAVVWRGPPALESWRRAKAPAPVAHPFAGRGLGCPRDCGICVGHRQRACTVLLEVTARCDLGCPVCFAASGAAHGTEPGLENLAALLAGALHRAGPVVLQLSGGEPTVRDDLPDIVALARTMGFAHVQLNTNGLRLARQPGYAARLADAGLGWIFLQFDGVTDDVYATLRGRPLLAEKLAAVEAAAAAGLGVVLVATVVPEVNDGQLGDLVRLAAGLLPRVRGVHLQPVSHFGRYPQAPDDSRRITLPEVMARLEAQTAGGIRATDLRPPGCEHQRCSFHGHFQVRTDGSFNPLSPPAGCCGDSPDAALEAAGVVARQWSAVSAPAAGPEQQGSLDAFLAATRGRTLTVTAMAFQDAWTLDLERLSGCCVHVAAPDGRLVPFCAWNLTARDGTPLHRPGANGGGGRA